MIYTWCTVYTPSCIMNTADTKRFQLSSISQIIDTFRVTFCVRGSCKIQFGFIVSFWVWQMQCSSADSQSDSACKRFVFVFFYSINSSSSLLHNHRLNWMCDIFAIPKCKCVFFLRKTMLISASERWKRIDSTVGTLHALAGGLGLAAQCWWPCWEPLIEKPAWCTKVRRVKHVNV